VDLVEISGGTYESAAMFTETVPRHASSQAREAFFLDYAAKVRGRTSLPLMVTGGFRTLAGMNSALAEGATDVVGLARPLAVEPDLPGRLLDGSATQAAPVKLATGVKALDALVQSAWYQSQISRTADGLAPRPRLSRLRAVAGYFAPRGR
jgi:2,4-dienoyl-CoA reductase-like NADH-dependent reductase (Old Yellow Enzyme family)